MPRNEDDIIRISDTNFIILAGGKSKRFGRNKITELLEGKSLLERVLENLTYFSGEKYVVIATDSVIPSLSKYENVRIINDLLPGKGSLGGLYTGLVKSNTLYNFVIAGDMPFINQRLVEYMGIVKEDYDIVVPRYKGKVEPLHAVYSKNCIPMIVELLEKNNLAVTELLFKVNTRYLTEDEIDKYDTDHLSFFNINTTDDYNKGKDLAAKRK